MLKLAANCVLALPFGPLIELVSGSVIGNLDVEAVGALHLRNTGI